MPDTQCPTGGEEIQIGLDTNGNGQLEPSEVQQTFYVCNGSPDASTASCVSPPSGIVSWWTADDTTADLEGINNGTVEGNLTYAPGVVGEAFVFDGASDIITPTTGIPVGNTDRTFEFWANPASLGSLNLEEVFLQYGTLGTAGEDFVVLLRGIPNLIWSQWGGGVQGGSVNVGTWMHLAVTSASGTITLFVNGQQVAAQAILPYNTPTDSSLYIGGYGVAPDGTERLTGMIDEMTVYNRALSQTEITSIYLAGSAGKCH